MIVANLENRFNKSTAISKTAATPEETHTRRVQDGITSKDPTRKLNLDRRAPNSERRVSDDSNYCGPVRRYTIDRRLKTKDRRKPD